MNDPRFSAQAKPRLSSFTFGRPIGDAQVLEQVYAFDKEAYADGGSAASAPVSRKLFFEWWEAFPNGFLGAFEADRPLAISGLFPVTEEWAELFLGGALAEADLEGPIIRQAIDASDGLSPIYWYWSGLSSKAPDRDLRSKLPCILGYTLLSWLRLNAALNGSRNIRIVAEGATSLGERLLRNHFNFDEAAQPGGCRKPRFSTETSAKLVGQYLTRNPFFRKCAALQSETVQLAAI